MHRATPCHRSAAQLAALLAMLMPVALVHAAVGNSPNRPQDTPRTVTVSGKLVDAITGEPVQRFIIQAGHFDPKDPAKVTWGYSETRSSARNGTFRTTVRWNEGWTARILADGYVPQPVLAKAPPADKNRIEVTLRMERGRYVRGKVLDYEGKPVAGAAVFAVGPTGVNLAAGKAMTSFGQGEDDKLLRATTDEQGRFERPVGEATRLAISSTKLDAWPYDLPEEGEEVVIRLPQPGKLVIWFDIDGAEKEGEIFWQLLGHKMDNFKGVRVERQRKIPAGESLVLAGVTPGPYQIARYRMLRTAEMGFGKMLDRTFLTVKPGETQVVRFVRPTGSQVNGRVLGLSEAKLSTALISIRPDPEPKSAEMSRGWLVLDARTTDAKGNFVTERLSPGTYVVTAEGYPPLTEEQRFLSGIRRAEFTAEARITIPEEGEPPALDLKLEPAKR